MITWMESSCIYTGKGLVRKWSEPIWRRDRFGAVKVHSRLWRETALQGCEDRFFGGRMVM
jgi:hypothetical protein